MKKNIKILLSILLLTTITFSTNAIVVDEGLSLSNILANYVAFSTINESYAYGSLNFEGKSQEEQLVEIKGMIDYVYLEINDGKLMFWNSDFVLNFIAEYFPNDFDAIYSQLLNQGYNENQNMSIELTNDLVGAPLVRSTGTSLSHSVYDGHGNLALKTSNYIAWDTNANGTYSIFGKSATRTDGYSIQLNRSSSIQDNNTSRAFVYNSYSYYKDNNAYTYQVVAMLGIYPQSSTVATLTELYASVDYIAYPWS